MAFTPLSALAGGALIGVSASMLLALDGRVAGISGIVGGLLRGSPSSPPFEKSWRAAFLGGFIAASYVLAFVARGSITPSLAVTPPVWITIMAGLLVGYGTQLGNGCTSGHGVCGISRGSKRSIVATATFMAVAMVSTFVVQHLILRSAT